MATTKQNDSARVTSKPRRKHGGDDQPTPAKDNRKKDFERMLMLSDRHPTFAQMLVLQRDSLRRLKLPPWLFQLTYQRRDQASLSETQRERFLCALNVLIANGTYGQLVDAHAGMYMQHTNDRLLPWHRIFLLQLEQALRAIHPDVSIPYWDWTQASEQSIPSWLTSVLPTVVTPTRTLHVTRSPGTTSDLAMIASNVPTIMGYSNWSPFSSSINGVHGSVHVWVGGLMSDPSTAAADPIFWMHHCNLDRLWWQWHLAHSSINPPLSGASAVMNPWSYTEPDTRNINTLGYSYA